MIAARDSYVVREGGPGGGFDRMVQCPWRDGGAVREEQREGLRRGGCGCSLEDCEGGRRWF